MVWQIIKKEIIHNKHWMGLALGFLLFFTTVIYVEQVKMEQRNTPQNYAVNSEISLWSIYGSGSYTIHIRSFSALYFFSAAGLGILVGVSQFWVPFFTNTWKFTLHRPIKRSAALTLMLLSAAFIIALIAGGSWTILWLKAKSQFTLPPTTGALAEGWLFVLEGFVAYLAVALAALNQHRWYTAKFLPLLFAFLTWIVMWTTVSFTGAIMAAGIYILIVMPLIYRKFETREF
ncbi:MAG: hypothetical protein ACIAQZ_17060 [Sedimentisphaeraceae bacterium JB056]